LASRRIVSECADARTCAHRHRRVHREFAPDSKTLSSVDGRSPGEPVAFGVGIILVVAAVLPNYLERFDFDVACVEAVGPARKAYIDAYRWILVNTKPTDFFLSVSDDLDLSIVGPADRNVVVTCLPEFSSPYVDWKSRFEAASQMVRKLALAAPDVGGVLAANQVKYIIRHPSTSSISFLSFPRNSWKAMSSFTESTANWRASITAQLPRLAADPATCLSSGNATLAPSLLPQ
jgi:hypothetical protein